MNWIYCTGCATLCSDEYETVNDAPVCSDCFATCGDCGTVYISDYREDESGLCELCEQESVEPKKKETQ